MRQLILLLLTAAFAHAATTITQTFTVNTSVPDNDDFGFADYRNISAPGLTEIQSITVGLQLYRRLEWRPLRPPQA